MGFIDAAYGACVEHMRSHGLDLQETQFALHLLHEPESGKEPMGVYFLGAGADTGGSGNTAPYRQNREMIIPDNKVNAYFAVMPQDGRFELFDQAYRIFTDFETLDSGTTQFVFKLLNSEGMGNIAFISKFLETQHPLAHFAIFVRVTQNVKTLRSVTKAKPVETVVADVQRK